MLGIFNSVFGHFQCLQSQQRKIFLRSDSFNREKISWELGLIWILQFYSFLPNLDQSRVFRLFEKFLTQMVHIPIFLSKLKNHKAILRINYFLNLLLKIPCLLIASFGVEGVCISHEDIRPGYSPIVAEAGQFLAINRIT